MPKKITKEQFIERAKIIHGDKYDYSKTNYVNTDTKVCIICPKHGEFWQTPHDHLGGHGCAKCGFESGFSKQRKTSEQFIKDAIQIYGSEYDYSKVNYFNAYTKVCIICSKHGEFWQTPHDHLKGRKCPKCSESLREFEIRKFLTDKTNEEFVYQYCSDWLGLQRIDFFFPKQNFGIEFDGEQHFKPINWKGALTEEQCLEKFNEVIRNDRLKEEKCLFNKVKLYRIAYNSDIEKELTKILKLYNIEIKEKI